MKLSGHNYNNDVFSSLLDNLGDDVVLKKKASKETSPIGGMEVFSSTTEDELENVQEDLLSDIVAELQFAADNAKVAVSKHDLATFAKHVSDNNLRGKKIERAARQFCNELGRATALPVGDTRRVASLNEQLNPTSNSVVPANYNPDYGPNNSKTGGFLGMSKNPNTIWDDGALEKMAQNNKEYTSMFGDEQIKQSKEQNKEFKKAMKDEMWQEKQNQLSDPNMIHSKIASIHTGKEAGTDQKLPANAMSIFNNDRDFSNIPERTDGEKLGEQAAERSNKSANSKSDWNQVKSSKKVDNSLLSFFAGDTQNVDNSTSSQRESIDQIFEGLIKRK